MRKETISLNQKKQQRLMVFNHVEREDLTGKQAKDFSQRGCHGL